MTEDEALFLAAVANAEQTPALALADWFDEHNEPALAVALRTVPELVPFLHELMRWDQVPGRRPLYRHESGAWREAWPLLPTALLLFRYRHLFPPPHGALDPFDPNSPTARNHRGEPLNADGFVRSWSSQRRRQISALRERATRLASSWPPAGRFPGGTPKGMDAFEWRSCLLHELVLHDRPPVGRAAKEHVATMRDRDHPLARLPLQYLPIEANLLLEQVWPIPPVLVVSRTPTDPPPQVTSVMRATGGVALAVVRSWYSVPSGDADGAACQFDRPVTVARHGLDWLPAFPDGILAVIEGHAATLRTLSPADAFRQLFDAARNGGAHGGGEFGAYGRLGMWRSASWLTGCDAGADCPKIAAAAAACEWYSIDIHEQTDASQSLGFLCVRPDRLSAAVLLATDEYE